MGNFCFSVFHRRRCALLAITLLVATAPSLHAETPTRTLHTRGVDLQLPLNVRILIDEKDRPFEIHGQDLRDEKGRLVGSEDLKCAPRNDLLIESALLKGPVQASTAWMCRNANYQRLITTPVELKPLAGFIGLGSSMFRGSLHLIPSKDSLLIVNELDLEDYLAGIINKEVQSAWPEEAIKAQVVAARSYAIATIADRRRHGSVLFDLQGNESDQVYVGSHVEDSKSSRLVNKTRGEVLMHMEDVLRAFYHASSGGHSELPENVWLGEGLERDRRAFLARESPVDATLPQSKWSIRLTPEMGSLLPRVGRILSMKVLGRTAGLRVKKIQITGNFGAVTFSGPEFRNLMPKRWIRSTYFDIQEVKGGWILEGHGWGHGVGLSQWGARQMAKNGKSYEDILSFYYPFASLRKLKLGDDETVLRIPVRAR